MGLGQRYDLGFRGLWIFDGDLGGRLSSARATAVLVVVTDCMQNLTAVVNRRRPSDSQTTIVQSSRTDTMARWQRYLNVGIPFTAASRWQGIETPNGMPGDKRGVNTMECVLAPGQNDQTCEDGWAVLQSPLLTSILF